MYQNETADSRLLFAHYRRLVRIATKRVGAGEAEDIVQSSFVKFLDAEQNLRLKDSTKLQAYLTRIVERTVIDRFRKSSLRRPQSTKYPHENSMEPVAIDDAANRLEVKDYVEKILQKLTARQRELIRLRFFEDKKISELAKHFSVSKRTISKWLKDIRHTGQRSVQSPP